MIRRAGVDDVTALSEFYQREFDGAADFTGFIANPLNVAVRTDDGAAFFVWHGPGIYEAHCCFAERGAKVREVSRQILDTMRDDHGAKLIWAAIPNESRKVKIFAHWLGFASAGPITLPHGECELFTLEMN